MSSTTAAFSDAAKAAASKRFPDGSVDFFVPSDFVVDCTTVNLNKVLARGSYGVVYEGTWNGDSYAIKIEDFTSAVEDQANLIVELTLLQSLPHSRMVRFYGAGYQPDSLTGPKVMKSCIKQNFNFPLVSFFLNA
jgi:serine/threonine protein kinase